MRSRSLSVLLFALVLAAVSSAACGNYSNEDLEFMNALPEGDELRVGSPAGQSAIILPTKAELARQTHGVSSAFNDIVAGVVGLVDLIRSFPPTTRTPDSRTWGPASDDDHAGWQWRMRISREPGDGTRLNYEIAYHRVGTADTEWLLYLLGWFQAGQTARRGMGHFEIDTALVRAAGLPQDGNLDTMDVDYMVGADSKSVHLDLANLPNPADPSDATNARYDYQAASDGRRQMSFELAGNFVLGPQIETVAVLSRWLDSGEGRATSTILEGEGAGLMREQCWNDTLDQTYNATAWAPADSFGDISACPDIPEIPAL